MLATLLESRGRSPRRRVAMTASVVAHSVLLIVLVMARARGSSADGADDPLPTNIVYIDPEQQRPRQHDASSTPPPNRGLVAPPDIAPVTVDPGAIADVMQRAGPLGPIVPAFPPGPFTRADTVAPAAGDSGDVLTSLAVDHPVEIVPGQRPPRYPIALERAGIAGDVTVQFIVDTTGRVERRSLTILTATHPEFARVVQERLGALRFVPARVRGHVVRQLVEQRFHFEVVRR